MRVLLPALLALCGALRGNELLLPGDPFGELTRLRLARAGEDALRATAPDAERELELRAGLGKGGPWLEGGAAARLAPHLRARLWLAGTGEEGGEALLGTHTTRGGWTGRILRSTLTWESPHVLLEWGRRSLCAGEDRISELAWSRQVPPVDMARGMLRTRDGRLSLELACARLSSQQDAELNRWYARHRVVWLPGGGRDLRLACGDQVLYTGASRGPEWSLLNPFIPFFLENFEGYSEAAHGQSVDGDNSSLFFTLDAGRPLSPRLRAGCYLDLLVDEFQLDAADRRKLDDALGVTAGLELQRQLPAGRALRLRWEGSALSHWVYIHRGRETSFLEQGHVIGNEEGGDLVEQHIQVQLYRLEGRLELLSLTAGRIWKGGVAPGAAWEAEATKDAPWPLPPVRRSWRFAVVACVQPSPRVALGAEAERRTAGEGWTLRCRVALRLAAGESR